MKKTLPFILGLVLGTGLWSAQYGSCANALPITNGYTQANITSAGTGTAPESWVTSFSPQCVSTSGGTYYYNVFTSSGGDYLMSYTTGSNPGEDISITIQTHANYHGIAMFTSCNGTAFDDCLDFEYSASPSTKTLTATNLPANTTVYIAVGIWAAPNNLNFSVTDFTVSNAQMSTSEVDSKKKVEIYPNPVTDFLNIANLKSNASVSILDVAGRQVHTYSITPDEKIDVSKLKSGVYMVKVATKEEEHTLKIIKK